MNYWSIHVTKPCAGAFIIRYNYLEMSLMKKICKFLICLAISGFVFTANAKAPYVPLAEKLTYKVMYKWGLISKQAGTVKLTTHSFDNGLFESTLVGHSARWADKFYSVRDTLMGTIMEETLEPVYYEKISHEGGEFKRDVIVYDRSVDGVVSGDCKRWRQKKENQPVIQSTKSLTGTRVTLDMLSSFYYMRHIDYPKMKVGESVITDIFSGQKKEVLKITYQGLKIIEVEGKKYTCYYITFTFTGDDGAKSSDDMSAWISNDYRRIPIMLLGNLPVGSIRCYFQPEEE